MNVFLQPIAGLDSQFEEEIKRNPYRVSTWWAYAHSKNDQLPVLRFAVYERALSFLPRSYKLWSAYLKDRTDNLRSTALLSKKFDLLIDTYERALAHMHKMPRVWLNYCRLLVSIRRGTQARKTFDRALQALPVTQHKELWKLYVEWATAFGVPETAIRVFRRYLMYDPHRREEFIAYLESIGQFGEAAHQLTLCLNDEHYVSPSGSTHHQLWMKLCEMCCSHPEKVVDSVAVEAIVRSGIRKFSDEVGKLWNSLADFYIGLGQFEKARSIYEEAINSVSTVRDFTIIFDAYVKVEESVLTAKMRFLQEAEDQEDGREWEKTEDGVDINLRLARIEYLMEQRPLMLNSVVLRQNPHNVHEWHKRVKLLKNDEARQLLAFAEAVKTISPSHAVGKLSTIYITWASTLEKQRHDLAAAENLFAQAVKVNFKSVDELATVWCAWAEMEMRHERYEEALSIMQRAVEEPQRSEKRIKAIAAAQGKGRDAEQPEGAVAADKVYKHVKVWALYLDLEESLGSIASCRSAYDRCMDLKVITAQMALNYASFLEENHFFEDSFRVYERAVALFEFPQLKKIWLTYLDKFIARYEGTKIERLRDLFEQALEKVPAEDAAEFYIKYARAEEQYGLARHVVAIYDRATKAVPEKSRLDLFRLYIKKVEQLFGIVKTRPIYEVALRELSDDMCKDLCKDYAEMERKLGEIDRSRAILQYGSQFADPRRDLLYWSQWREFEENYGNEETFREMLRVQRSVEVAFSHVHYLAQDLLTQGKQQGTGGPSASQPATGMDLLALEAEKEVLDRSNLKRKFVAADSAADETVENEDRESKHPRNDEEIDL